MSSFLTYAHGDVLPPADFLDPCEGYWTPDLDKRVEKPSRRVVGSLMLTDEEQYLREFFENNCNDVPFGD